MRRWRLYNNQGEPTLWPGGWVSRCPSCGNLIPVDIDSPWPYQPERACLPCLTMLRQAYQQASRRIFLNFGS